MAARTDTYVSGLSPADLDRVVDLSEWGFGTMNVGELLLTYQIGHIHQHTGELSAPKGLRGEKGYPF